MSRVARPDPARPQTYQRRVLLCVTGLSPQVVTETLYALTAARSPQERFVPTEVRVITTAEGAERIRLQLLSEDPGWFRRLLGDYGLPHIRFDSGCVEVLRGADGEPLEDIRVPQDNEAAADLILERVRELTTDTLCALHASMAGGRKTMGYYLGYAMSLCGRPQDRLSHVLVESPYESHPDFFYPAPRERVIFTPGTSKPLDASKARVWLAEIPFVSMRHALETRLHETGTRFSEAVEAAREALAPPELVIDLEGRRIRVRKRVVELSPAELALYAVFARRAKEGGAALCAPPKGGEDEEWAERYLQEYRRIRGEMDDIEATERALRRGMDGEYFSFRKAKLHRRLRDALGAAAEPYLICAEGRKPRRYRLGLPPHAIRFAAIGDD